MISTFGCNNGLILSGPRAYYAMAKDGLFFQSVGKLNRFHVPAWAIFVQAILAVFYVCVGATVAFEATPYVLRKGGVLLVAKMACGFACAMSGSPRASAAS